MDITVNGRHFVTRTLVGTIVRHRSPTTGAAEPRLRCCGREEVALPIPHADLNGLYGELLHTVWVAHDAHERGVPAFAYRIGDGHEWWFDQNVGALVGVRTLRTPQLSFAVLLGIAAMLVLGRLMFAIPQVGTVLAPLAVLLPVLLPALLLQRDQRNRRTITALRELLGAHRQPPRRLAA